MKHNYKCLCLILFVVISLLTINCGDMVGPMGFNFGGRIPDPGDKSENHIYIMDIDGNNQCSLNVGGSDPIFSPDGSKIISGYDELIIMDVDGSNVTDLGMSSPYKRSGWISAY